jgi:hypothetical protein
MPVIVAVPANAPPVASLQIPVPIPAPLASPNPVPVPAAVEAAANVVVLLLPLVVTKLAAIYSSSILPKDTVKGVNTEQRCGMTPLPIIIILPV